MPDLLPGREPDGARGNQGSSRVTSESTPSGGATVAAREVQRYIALLSTFPGMAFRRRNDRPGTLDFVSEGSRELLGIAPEDLTSGRRSYLSLIHPEDRPAFNTYSAPTITGSRTAQAEYRIVLDDGTIKWVSGRTHAIAAEDGTTEFIHGYIVDITERRMAELRDRHRVSILAALATRAPLREVLEAIVRSMEAEDPLIVCCIMLLDKSRQWLKLGAAPSLQPSIQASLNGMEVSVLGGPSSIAVITGQRFIVHDLRAHPSGATKTGQLLIHEAQRLSSWAEPIFASNGRLLCTISILHREPHTPTDDDIERVARAANYVRLALDLKTAISTAQESNRLAQATLDSLGAHLAVLNAEGIILATNKVWREYARENLAEPELLGKGTNHLVYLKETGESGRSHNLLRYRGIKDVIDGTRDIWIDEYAVTIAGEERWFYCRVTRVTGAGPVRVVVVHADVSDLRQAQQTTE